MAPSSTTVVIIDSGICNLFNVQRAFESIGAQVTISRSKKDILGAERIVLPGVGAFGPGMESLSQHDLIEPIAAFVKSGKPLLGICLGMQMLMTTSEELGVWKGLDLVKGRVRMFQKPESSDTKFKIPQIGWNVIEKSESKGTILNGLGEKPYVYFVHSFVVEPEDPRHVLGATTYGRNRFCSVLRKDNISACQFHPERSGPIGLKVLQNFLKEPS